MSNIFWIPPLQDLKGSASSGYEVDPIGLIALLEGKELIRLSLTDLKKSQERIRVKYYYSNTSKNLKK